MAGTVPDPAPVPAVHRSVGRPTSGARPVSQSEDLGWRSHNQDIKTALSREVAGMIHENLRQYCGRGSAFVERRREFVTRYCTRRRVGQLQRGSEHLFVMPGKGGRRAFSFCSSEATPFLHRSSQSRNPSTVAVVPITPIRIGTGTSSLPLSNAPKVDKTSSDIDVQLILMKGERRFSTIELHSSSLLARLAWGFEGHRGR